MANVTYGGYPDLVVSFSLRKLVFLYELQWLLSFTAFVNAIDEVLLNRLVQLQLNDFSEAEKHATRNAHKSSLLLFRRFLFLVYQLDWIETALLHRVLA